MTLTQTISWAEVKMMRLFFGVWEFIKCEILAPAGEWISGLVSGGNRESEEEGTPFVVSEYIERAEKGM